MTTYSGQDFWEVNRPRWPTVQLKSVAALGTGHTPSRSKPEYWENCTIPWVTTEDLTSRNGTGLEPLIDTRQRISELGLANSAAVLHPAGTVMLSRTASIGHSVLTARPMATTQAFVTWHCGPQLNPRYLLAVMKAMQPEFDRLAYGSTHLTIYMPDIEQLRVPLPPIDTQTAIADFLDAETARMDALIAKKQRFRHLLAAKRQASIDGTFREAGRLVRAKFLASDITSGPRGWAAFASDSGSLFLRVTNVPRDGIQLDMRDALHVRPPAGAEARRTRVKAGDVLVSITADIGSVGMVQQAQAGGYISQHVARLRPTSCMAKWLAYGLSTSDAAQQLNLRQYGGTKTQLALSDVGEVLIPAPPPAEQQARIRTLERGLRVLYEIDNGLNEQVALLRERRQALITAAVTGQIEVPGVAA